MLGNLHEHLDPYEIFWEMRNGETVLRIWDTDVTQLSQDNRVLSIAITEPVDTAMYQCSLEVSRCTRFNENNEVMERCPIDGMSPFRGPMVSLNILGKS